MSETLSRAVAGVLAVEVCGTASDTFYQAMRELRAAWNAEYFNNAPGCRMTLTERERWLMQSAWHGRSGWPALTFDAWLAMRLPSDRINADGLAADAPTFPHLASGTSAKSLQGNDFHAPVSVDAKTMSALLVAYTLMHDGHYAPVVHLFLSRCRVAGEVPT
jgi:hypothetical protein